MTDSWITKLKFESHGTLRDRNLQRLVSFVFTKNST